MGEVDDVEEEEVEGGEEEVAKKHVDEFGLELKVVILRL